MVDPEQSLDRQRASHVHVLPSGSLESVAPLDEVMANVGYGHDRGAILTVGDRLRAIALDCPARSRRVSQRVMLQLESRGQLTIGRRRERIVHFRGNHLAVFHPIQEIKAGVGSRGEGHFRLRHINSTAKDRTAFRGTGRDIDGEVFDPAELIDPCPVRALASRFILEVAPAHVSRSGWEFIGPWMPVDFPRYGIIPFRVDEKLQRVKIRLRRHFPEERELAGPDHGGVHPHLLVMEDRAAPRGIRSVLGDIVLAGPHRMTTGGKSQIRPIHGVAKVAFPAGEILIRFIADESEINPPWWLE